MSELFVGMFTWIFAWPVLAILVLVSAVFDHRESPVWESLTAALSIFVLFQLIDVSWLVFGIVLVCYIPIGILWSYYRWRKQCNDIVRELTTKAQNKETITKFDKNIYNRKLDFDQNIKTMAFWILVWPFSMISNVIGDLYDALCILISTRLSNKFRAISNKAMDQIQKLDQDRELNSNNSCVDTDELIRSLGGNDNIRSISYNSPKMTITVFDTNKANLLDARNVFKNYNDVHVLNCLGSTYMMNIGDELYSILGNPVR